MKLSTQRSILVSMCCLGWQISAQTTNEENAQPRSDIVVQSPSKVQEVLVPQGKSNQTPNVAVTHLLPQGEPQTQSGTLPIVVPTTQSEATPPKTSAPVPVIAPPADIASLTAKEILSANNQVVCQVASMYQHLGLFITIIVTLLGVVATYMGYVARKSLSDFIQDWNKKLETLENDLKADKVKMLDAIRDAEASARKAAEHERSITDSKQVLSETLKEVDRLRQSVSAICEQVRQTPTNPQIGAPSVTQPQPEAVSASEAAEVAAQLEGKINSGREG